MGGLFPKDHEILASFIFLLKRGVEGHKEQNLSEFVFNHNQTIRTSKTTHFIQARLLITVTSNYYI